MDGYNILLCSTFDGKQVFKTSNQLLSKIKSSIKESFTCFEKIGGTSTKDQTVLPIIKVYPNPVFDVLSIYVEDLFVDGSQIFFYDLLGKQVMNAKIENGVNEVDVFTLPNGSYIYKIINKGLLVGNGKVMKY